MPTTSVVVIPPMPKGVVSGADDHAPTKVVQQLLQSHGFYAGQRIDGDFGPRTEDAISDFQQTHLGEDGKYLKVTGKLDAATWWALHNASGAPQQSRLSPLIPHGLNTERRRFLQLWADEHAKNVREVPDGSNWGGRISEYLKGVGPCPWCCFTFCWMYKQTTGAWPMGTRQGLVAAFWNAAKKAGTAYEKGTRRPMPGDAFVMLYRGKNGRLNGTGHIGVVASVSKDGKSFNTFAGNEGNRLKYGVRVVSQSTLVGFVSLLPEEGCQPEPLLVSAEDADKSGTR